MICSEFKKLALAEPNSAEPSFIRHSKDCPDCLQYVGEIRQMDTDLSNSLDVAVPSSIMAKIELNQMLIEEEEQGQEASSGFSFNRYAIAASFALALFVSGFMANSFLGGSRDDSLGEDYLALLSGVIEHVDEQPMTPVWSAEKANEAANMHLSNYDGAMKLKFLENLQFTRICPMGKYRGLHASLETDSGSVTFAYIKGDKVDDLLDASYEGYAVRVKPLRDGNLIIVSNTNKALQQADKQLDEAIYWNI